MPLEMKSADQGQDRSQLHPGHGLLRAVGVLAPPSVALLLGYLLASTGEGKSANEQETGKGKPTINPPT